MPIVRLLVENYMRVVHADIEPHDGVNEITGLNTHGKTSLLSAIATMGGKREVAWKPIHDGADEARITIDMDGVGEVPLRMIRSIKRREDGELVHTLQVEGPGGGRMPKADTLLKAIVGEFSFDPLSILAKDPKELQDILKGFVPDYDFASHKKAYDADFEDRTDTNRRLKALESQVAGIDIPDGTPTEPVDETALVNELQAVGEENTSIETRRANRQRLADESARFRADANISTARASDLRRQADAADEEAARLVAAAELNDKKVADAGLLPPQKDATEIRAKIDLARATNVNVAALQRRNALIRQAEELQKDSDSLTAALKQRDAAKTEAIKKAKMPVDGLTFDEDGVVMFNGQPLDQASQAEKIRVSVAIAAALSPRLKVAIVKDGSLLDRNSWALLEKYASEHGLQVFVETVDSSRPTAIVIEDGRVREPILAAAE